MHIPLHYSDNRCYAAFRLDRILMVSALGEYAHLYENAPDFHQRMLLQHQYEFVNTILRSSDASMSHALQMRVFPDPEHPHRGSIDVHCIIAMPADRPDVATRAQALFQLLHAQYRDMVWLPAPDVAAVLAVPDARYAVSINRTAGFVNSSSHGETRGFAFTGVHAPRVASQRPPMFVVHPFVHSDTPHHALFGFLLQLHTPLTISIRLQKTQLTAAELRFCQENLTTFDDPRDFPTSVAEQLLNTQRIMHSLLQRSHDCAALLDIDIVSAAPIPDHAVSLLGNVLTQPVGGWYKSSDSAGHPIHYHGGYSVTTHIDATTVIAAVCTVSATARDASAQPVVDRLPQLVDASEAAMVMRFPRSSLVPLPGVTMQPNRIMPTPTLLPEAGTRIGAATRNGREEHIHISDSDRTRHTYLIGQTGTGKSTVLKQMMLDDMTRGRGLCLIDPHGDLVEDMLSLIPADRHADVIVIDPTQTDFPIGLNPFTYTSQAEREINIQLFQKTVELVEHARGTPDLYLGPAFWQHLRNNAYWITQNPDDHGTIIELYNMIAMPEYHERWYPIDETDGKLVSWKKTMENTEYHKIGSDGFSSFSYFSSKLEDFIFDTRLRLMFGQKTSNLNVFEAMNTNKIILINLSRGVLSEIASTFLGGVLLAQIQHAALKRAELAPDQRAFYGVYVDEFQNYTSDSFISLLSESRKYGISLTLANQFLAQISNTQIISAVLGNVGTIVSFRVGIQDAELLRTRFAPEVTSNDLINLPNWHAYVATHVHGQSVRPFSMHTIPPPVGADSSIRAAILSRSAAQYGTPRATVEATIARSMQLHIKRTDIPRSHEPLPTQTIDMRLVPFPHEHVSIDMPLTRYPLIQGNGLILLPYAGGLQHNVHALRIGPPPLNRRMLQAYRIDECIPFAAGWGDGHAAFKHWVAAFSATTMGDVERLLTQQFYTGEVDASAYTYATALLAYVMHDHPVETLWRDIALAVDCAVALDHTGTAWVWNALTHATPHEIHNARAIASSTTHCYVVHADMTLWAYAGTAPVQIKNLPPVVTVVSGERNIYALEPNGRVHHIAGSAIKDSVTLVQETPMRLVAAGNRHGVGVDFDGTVQMWGYTARHNDIPADLRAGRVNVVALAAGYQRSYALDANGRLYIWGNDSLSPEALHAANVIGVQQIYAIGKQFFYQTKDNLWRSEGTPITHIDGVDPTTIARLFITERHMAAFTCLPPHTHRVAQQWRVQLRDVAGITEQTALAWQDIGVSTVFAYLLRDPQESRTLPFFVAHPDALAPFEACIAAHLHAARISPPDAPGPLTIRQLQRRANGSAWYFAIIGPEVSDTTGAKKRRDDDFDFDRDDDFFADV